MQRGAKHNALVFFSDFIPIFSRMFKMEKRLYLCILDVIANI